MFSGNNHEKVNAPIGQKDNFTQVDQTIQDAPSEIENTGTIEAAIVSELKKGEASGFVQHFDYKAFLKQLHQKHNVGQ